MTAGRAVRGAGGLVLVFALVRLAGGAEDRAEVRVLSGPGAASAITVRAAPDVAIEDRTAGAHPAADRRGPASVGETFTGEISLFLRGFTVSRPSAIDVGDAVVSAVRLFPESGGTTVSVFVRQPVTYTVSRASAIGEIRIEVRARRPPPTRAGRPPQPGGPRLPQPADTSEGEVAVDAESLSYDQQSDTLTARGGVTLTRGETTLTADEVVYDRTNQIAEARGHVVLRDPQATVEGDFAHLNLADETGWVEDATANLETNHYILRGGRIEKEGGPRYSVADGAFTTCECGGLEKPSWSILGRSTRVTLEGAGVVRGLTFRVKDVPVFWFPYFVFPANTERQTGFLIPRVGYSNRRGFQYEQPFYWAINKSSDATVAVDVETAARVGVIGEYRYRLSRTARGAFVAGYYNQRIGGNNNPGVLAPVGTPTSVPENRFIFAGHHTQRFPLKSRFYLDLFAVSDDQFLREIDSFALSANQDYAIRSLRFTTSRTGVIKAWDRGLAWVEGAYYQDLIDPEDLALQRLPRIEAEHSVPLLGDRLLGRLAAEAVDYQRTDGYDGLRGDITPEVFLPLRLGRVLQGSITGRLRETAYYLTDRDQVAVVVPDAGVFPAAGYERFRVAKKLPRLDASRTREMGEVHGELRTEIARVFDFPYLGFEKLRHSIEPEVQYLYVPQVGRPSFEVPLPSCGSPTLTNPQPGINCNATLFSEGYLFDERDAINRRNFLSYGITTRVLARTPTAAETAARPSAAAEEAEAKAEDEAEEEDEEEEFATAQGAIDQDAIAPGIPSLAIPEFVGPPAPGPRGTRPPPAPREILRASILQGYDISRELVGSSHLSDVDLGIRLLPVDYLALSYNATVNIEESAVRGQSVGLVLREPWWTPSRLARYQTATTIGIGYRFVEENVNRLDPSSPEALLLGSNGLNEIQGSAYLRLGKYMGFTFIARYDLNSTVVASSTPGQSETLGPHFLERDYLLRFMSRCNCWILDVGVSDKFNPDERSFRIQLTLVGLGSFGRGPTTQNYVGLPGMGGLRRLSGPGAY